MKTRTVRIYAVADIHGKGGRLDRIRANARTLVPDVVVMAGDITNFLHSWKVLAEINRWAIPVLMVRGNTDLPAMEDRLCRFGNISTLHLTRIVVGGISFAGVSGTALLPFRSQVRYREKAVIKRLSGLVGDSSVLVAHPPPLGVRDEVLGRFHSGSRRLFHLISARKPALMICGHIHERAGTGQVGQTRVVNCSMGRKGGGALIEMSGGRVDTITML